MSVTIQDLLDEVEQFRYAIHDANAASGLYNTYLRWCGHCGEVLRFDRYPKKKQNARPGWMHSHNGGIWCKNDKQHGPKTRHAFPLPSLLVIEEMEL